jgi:tetratricopeptide (TPR) repeat protein
MQVDPVQFMQVVRPALASGDATRLAEEVRSRWTPRQLCGLLGHPKTDIRRVTAITLGLVGDRGCVGCLARALHDEDEQVNQMAEHGLWSIWFRSGKPAASKPFSDGVALLCAESYPQAMEKFEEAFRIDPNFAEAYNQCAIAHFFLGEWEPSIRDCERTIKLMPSHFGAVSGMGHCYAQVGELKKALQCYRRALAINPRMPAIARAVRRLQAKLRAENDSSGIYEPSLGR